MAFPMLQMFGGLQPRRRLTLADLLGEEDPYANFQPPPAPQFAQTFRDLPQEQRRGMNTEALLSLAGLIAQGSSSGRLGEALAAGAQNFHQVRRQGVDDYNRSQQAVYEKEREAAQQSFAVAQARSKAQKERAKAQGLLDTVGRILGRDADLANLAETYARTGQEEKLAELEKSLAMRGAIRARGVDPDDPIASALVQKQAEADLALEMKRKEEEALGPLRSKREREDYAAKEDIETAELAERAARGLGPLDGGGGGGRPGQYTNMVERADGLYIVDRATGEARPVANMPDDMDPFEERAWRLVEQDRQAFLMDQNNVRNGKEFDVTASFRRRVKEVRELSGSPRRDPAPAPSALRDDGRPAGSGPTRRPKTPAPRIQAPAGAPIGPTGGSGQEAPKESLQTYLRSLPPEIRGSQKLAARIQELRSQGLSDAQILARLKAGEPRR